MLVENDFLSVGYNPELTVHETASSGNLLCRHDLRLFIASGGSAQYFPARGQQSVKKRRNEAGFYPVSAGARQAAADQRGDHTFRKSAEHLSGPGQPAPTGRQPGSRSARQDHFRLSAKPGVKPGAGAGDRLLSAKQQPGDDAHYRAHRDAGQKTGFARDRFGADATAGAAGGDPDHPDCRSTAGVHRPSLSSGGGGDRPDRPAALDLAGTALALCRHRHPSRLFHHPAKRPDLLYGHRVREARHGLQHH